MTADQSTPNAIALKKQHHFTQKMNEIILDSSQNSPSKVLEKIADHVTSFQSPKKSIFDKLELFFKSIIEKIRHIMNSDDQEEKKETTMSQFNKYKQKLTKILPKDNAIEELEDEETLSSVEEHTNIP